MGATATAVFSSNSISQLPSFSALCKPNLGNRIPKEIAYGLSLSTNRRDFHCSTLSTIRADGIRRRKSSKDATPGKTSKGSELNIQPSPNSLNQEEIISLFKRIQSSISKGDSTSSKKRSTKSSEEKPAIDSVLEILRHSKTEAKGTKDDKGSTHQEDQKEPETDYSPTADPRSTRLRSSFVKRSPLQSPFNSKEKVKLKTETSLENHVESEAVKIEEMKLPQLKELAKSRGLKGYSKLKKSELVELLIGC
ncbi:rho-N domain-containing protein 1, chloroplastic [Solanum pennellii]|uniref:Rho-N domain-containing protein 1, chloroplastic n=1 Tax=Solanum pennellii TaxID=28526 RepID=A0ABM1G464_SOLPN|nr:rho-N domain-containing protein 1, chloroplastic [Solanum pennellii]